MLKAFHSDKSIKAKYLNRVIAHIKADEVIKGKYWKDGKGCAVGCTIHSSNHKAYEKELGIPEWLALLEDALFEGMSPQKAKTWPKRFLSSIKVGSDLDKIKIPFVTILLKYCLKNFDHNKHPDVKNCINDVITLYKRGGTKKQFVVANHKASAVAEITIPYIQSSASASAYAAANSASYAAYVGYYDHVDAYYVDVEAVAHATQSAAGAATYALCANYVNYAIARCKAYDKLASELIKLIKKL